MPVTDLPTDDRYALLMHLQSTIPLDAATFMGEFGWCGQRFAEAVYDIRKTLRISLSTGDTGESVTVRRAHWRAAQAVCEQYLQRHLLN